MDIYSRIDAVLQEKHMSRRQLAIAAEIPESTVAAWFTRRTRISLDDAIKICDALGICMNEIEPRIPKPKVQERYVFMAVKSKIPIPTESDEQKWLFQWAADVQGKYPELALMFHIPNEGKRSSRTGARMRREGLKRGVPDIFLPVPRSKYHGLFIELKRTKNSSVSDDQKGWIAALRRQGYDAHVCKGWIEAAEAIERYLKEGKQ